MYEVDGDSQVDGNLMFTDLQKVDGEDNKYWGVVIKNEVDRSGERPDWDATVTAIKKFEQESLDASGGRSRGNVREMHRKDSSAGIVEEYVYKPDRVLAKFVIADPVTNAKIKAGAIVGVSVGGSYLSKIKGPDGVTVYKPLIKEISVVDRPCGPSALLHQLDKSDGVESNDFIKYSDGELTKSEPSDAKDSASANTDAAEASDKPRVRIAEDDPDAVDHPDATAKPAEAGDLPVMDEADPQTEAAHIAAATDPVGPKKRTESELRTRLSNLADGKMPSHVEIKAGDVRYPEQLVHKGDVVMFDDVMQKSNQNHGTNGQFATSGMLGNSGKMVGNKNPADEKARSQNAQTLAAQGKTQRQKALASQRRAAALAAKNKSQSGGLTGLINGIFKGDQSDGVEKRFNSRKPRFWRNSQGYSYNHVGTVVANPAQRTAVAIAVQKSEPVMFDALYKFSETEHPRDNHGRFSAAKAQTPVKPQVKTTPKDASKLSQAERLQRAMDWYNTEGKTLPEYQRKDGESSPRFAKRIENQLHVRFGYSPLKAEYERRRLNAAQSQQDQAGWDKQTWVRNTVSFNKSDAMMFGDLYKFEESQHPRDERGRFATSGALQAAGIGAGLGVAGVALATLMSRGAMLRAARKFEVDALGNWVKSAGARDAAKNATETIKNLTAKAARATRELKDSVAAVDASKEALANETKNLADLQGAHTKLNSALEAAKKDRLAIIKEKGESHPDSKAATDTVDRMVGEVDQSEEAVRASSKNLRMLREKHEGNAAQQSSLAVNATQARTALGDAKTKYGKQMTQAQLAELESHAKAAEEALQGARRATGVVRAIGGAETGASIISRVRGALGMDLEQGVSKTALDAIDEAIRPAILRDSHFGSYADSVRSSAIKAYKDTLASKTGLKTAEDHAAAHEASLAAAQSAGEVASTRLSSGGGIIDAVSSRMKAAGSEVASAVSDAVKALLPSRSAVLGTVSKPLSIAATTAGAALTALAATEISDRISRQFGVTIGGTKSNPDGSSAIQLVSEKDGKKQNAGYIELDANGNVKTFDQTGPIRNLNDNGGNNNKNSGGGDFQSIMNSVNQARSAGKLNNSSDKDAFIANLNLKSVSDPDQRRKIINAVGVKGLGNSWTKESVSNYIDTRSDIGVYSGEKGSTAISADRNIIRALGGDAGNLHAKLNDLSKSDIVMFDDLMKFDEHQHPRDGHGRFSSKGDAASYNEGLMHGLGGAAALAAGAGLAYAALRHGHVEGLKNPFVEAAKAADTAVTPKVQNVLRRAPRSKAEAPINPSESLGVDRARAVGGVPLESLSKVPGSTTLRDVLETTDLKGTMRVPVGKTGAGDVIFHDFEKTSSPHLLVAGATGGGKSVAMNNVISTLAMHNSPSELRMALIDPKKVEFSDYKNLPHLVENNPIAKDAASAEKLLGRVRGEMMRRYNEFDNQEVKNLNQYNEKMANKMPKLLVAVDELSDITTMPANATKADRSMVSNINKHLEDIMKLGRAAGVHVVLATQHPSADTITQAIRANITSRIALPTSSVEASRAIIGNGDAKNLSGTGSMIYQQGGEQTNLTGTYLPDVDIKKIVKHLSGLEKSDVMMFDDLMKAGNWDESEHPRDKDGEFEDKNGGQSSGKTEPSAKKPVFDANGYSVAAKHKAEKAATEAGPEGSPEYLEAFHRTMMQNDPKYRSEHTQVIKEERGQIEMPYKWGGAGWTVGALGLGVAGLLRPTKLISTPVAALGGAFQGAYKGARFAINAGNAGKLYPNAPGGWVKDVAVTAGFAGAGAAKSALKYAYKDAVTPITEQSTKAQIFGRTSNALVGGAIGAIAGYRALSPVGEFLGWMHDSDNATRRVEKSDKVVLFSDLIKFEEAEHPRATDGKFAPKESGAVERGAGLIGAYAGMHAATTALEHFTNWKPTSIKGRVGKKVAEFAVSAVGGGIGSEVASRIAAPVDDAMGNTKTPESDEGLVGLAGGLAGSVAGDVAGEHVARHIGGSGTRGLITRIAMAGISGALGETAGKAVAPALLDAISHR